jgi:hypothetical protein
VHERGSASRIRKRASSCAQAFIKRCRASFAPATTGSLPCRRLAGTHDWGSAVGKWRMAAGTWQRSWRKKRKSGSSAGIPLRPICAISRLTTNQSRLCQSSWPTYLQTAPHKQTCFCPFSRFPNWQSVVPHFPLGCWRSWFCPPVLSSGRGFDSGTRCETIFSLTLKPMLESSTGRLEQFPVRNCPPDGLVCGVSSWLTCGMMMRSLFWRMSRSGSTE